jgi:hypothetical protein
MGSFYPRLQPEFLWLYFIWPRLPGSIAAAVNIKQRAETVDWIALFQPLDYRKVFNESDIKRAVAFFRISFSCSTRLSCFSSAWIRLCSGVSAEALGVFPFRSSLSWRTQYSIVDLPTPTASDAALIV